MLSGERPSVRSPITRTVFPVAASLMRIPLRPSVVATSRPSGEPAAHAGGPRHLLVERRGFLREIPDPRGLVQARADERFPPSAKTESGNLLRMAEQGGFGRLKAAEVLPHFDDPVQRRGHRIAAGAEHDCGNRRGMFGAIATDRLAAGRVVQPQLSIKHLTDGEGHAIRADDKGPRPPKFALLVLGMLTSRVWGFIRKMENDVPPLAHLRPGSARPGRSKAGRCCSAWIPRRQGGCHRSRSTR